MRATWTELIKVKALQSKLRIMVEKATADPTIGSYQQWFAEILEAKPAVPVPEASKGTNWWKGDDHDSGMAVKLYLERLME
jgi:hypothetical protein